MADNIDPTVNAQKEVKDVVTPLGRGLFSIFGRSGAQDGDVRRRFLFLNALTPSKQKDQQQSGGGGFFGFGGGGSAGGGVAGGVAGDC